MYLRIPYIHAILPKVNNKMMLNLFITFSYRILRKLFRYFQSKILTFQECNFRPTSLLHYPNLDLVNKKSKIVSSLPTYDSIEMSINFTFCKFPLWELKSTSLKTTIRDFMKHENNKREKSQNTFTF